MPFGISFAVGFPGVKTRPVAHHCPVTRPLDPWTSEAKALVLYRANGAWRFAIYNDEGIMDGRLDEVDEGAPVELAQAELLRRVQEATTRHYEADWSTDKPDWWSASLTTAL